MEKYNAETPDEVYFYSTTPEFDWDETIITDESGLTGFKHTTHYIKAPTEPVVPLREVLELLDEHCITTEMVEQLIEKYATDDMKDQLKQKYGVSE